MASDAAVVHVTEIESPNGIFRGLSNPLGVSGFRVNQLELGPGQEGPEHDHTANNQEEVYAVVGGSGTLRLFCPPSARRQMVAGDDGLVWIGIGSAVGDS
jgi:uncharacterized cupin superfamily protein